LQNVFDLLAIVPFDLMRGARLLRLSGSCGCSGASEVIWRISATFRGVMDTNRLGHGHGGHSGARSRGRLLDAPPGALDQDGPGWDLVEPRDRHDGGLRDLSPTTPEGRAVAAVLMLFGIGTIGMITGSIATYFLGVKGTKDPHIRTSSGSWAGGTN